MLRVGAHLPAPRGDGSCAAGSWRFAGQKSKQLHFCKQALGMGGYLLAVVLRWDPPGKGEEAMSQGPQNQF